MIVNVRLLLFLSLITCPSHVISQQSANPRALVKRPLSTVVGLSSEIGVPIETMNFEPSGERDRNITAIRYTEVAFAARLQSSELDVDLVQLVGNTAHYDVNDSILAEYMIWGHAEKGGTFSGSESSAADEHFIEAHDLCGIKNAFLYIVKSELRCIGDSVVCAYKSKFDQHKTVSRIFCSSIIDAALVEFTVRFGNLDTGDYFAVFGADNFQLPPVPDPSVVLADLTSEERLERSKTVDWKAAFSELTPGSVIKLVTTDQAMTILEDSGRVFSWSNNKPLFVQVSGNNHATILFADDIVANEVGFSALLNNGKVRVWGGPIMKNPNAVPREISDDSNLGVTKIFGFGECFVGLSAENSVHTWGDGERSFCQQSGGNHNTFVSYGSVREDLQSNVFSVGGNRHSLIVIKNDGSVITWGKKDDGGSKVPEPQFSFQWKEREIKGAVSESLVSTCCAYGLRRTDERLIFWGDRDNGGYPGKTISLPNEIGSQIYATDSLMSVITSDGAVLMWPGARKGKHSTESTGSRDEVVLEYAAKKAVPTAQGFIFILGYDCEFSVWSNWSPCSAECGVGLKTRNRDVVKFPLNGSCDGAKSETTTCNPQLCDEPVIEKQYDVPTTSLVLIIGLAAGGVAVTGIVVYFCFFGMNRSKTMAPRDPYDVSGYGGKRQHHRH